MTRDWELLRYISSAVQSCKAGKLIALADIITNQMVNLDIGEWKREQVYEHILLLQDSNLIEAEASPRNFGSSRGIVINRLTMAGHDFLEPAQNEYIWNKTMDFVNEKGVNVPLVTPIPRHQPSRGHPVPPPKPLKSP